MLFMDNALTKKLLSYLPKKYHDRVKKLEAEDGLIDDCRYMLYWTKEYTDGDAFDSCFPVKSISEAI